MKLEIIDSSDCQVIFSTEHSPIGNLWVITEQLEEDRETIATVFGEGSSDCGPWVAINKEDAKKLIRFLLDYIKS